MTSAAEVEHEIDTTLAYIQRQQWLVDKGADRGRLLGGSYRRLGILRRRKIELENGAAS